MAIGDTWETINTYAFVAGETIITADYENDVVNNLQYLYNNPSSAVNVYSGNTNTNVTVGTSATDVLAGLVLTFTPVEDKVLLLVVAYMDNANLQMGYKVNSGAITYIAQDNDSTQIYVATPTVTAGSSNTITMYVKNSGSSADLRAVRVVAIEMAN